jgi:hypothetical protein
MQQFIFSKNLRDEIKEYFNKKYSFIISDEQADEYLNSLADLYIIFDSMRE